MKFIPTNLDKKISPYTGLTRNNWIEAGKYILEGVFLNIKSIDSPVLFKRVEKQVSYPHLNKNGQSSKQQERAEIFEGLTRSMFIASPLIKDNPNISINGIKLKDYYRNQILKVCDEKDELYIGRYEDVLKWANGDGTIFQQTVETCALVICLWVSKEQIWDTYSKAEKDKIASLILSYANGPTHDINWRLFNMLDLAFLHSEGFEIDRQLMEKHTMRILSFYTDNGWYSDGGRFDYYSCWAFNFYAPLWNKWYGYENMPEVAKKFEENSNTLMQTYPQFFDKDGFTNMWGRSIIYRFGTVSAFVGNMFLNNSKINYGLARRICSGSLMQFLGREDLLVNGVPSLGFYGQFIPAIQVYSCAESPLWLGKAFLCLCFPQNHPFWNQTEENGVWEKLENKEVYKTTLNAPALCYTNHNANGTTILRTGKANSGIYNQPKESWSYNKLCYSTKYPWESSNNPNINSMQYTITKNNGDVQYGNYTTWEGEKSGVLYRKQYFNYNNNGTASILLADFETAYGIFRVDRASVKEDEKVEITLGSFGFSDNNTQIIEKERNGFKAIILKGFDNLGNKKQLAMTIFSGFDCLTYLKSQNTNPDSKNSIVVYAKAVCNPNGASILCSLTQTREDHEDFSIEELFPLEKYMIEKSHAVLYFNDGSIRTITF